MENPYLIEVPVGQYSVIYDSGRENLRKRFLVEKITDNVVLALKCGGPNGRRGVANLFYDFKEKEMRFEEMRFRAGDLMNEMFCEFDSEPAEAFLATNYVGPVMNHRINEVYNYSREFLHERHVTIVGGDVFDRFKGEHIFSKTLAFPKGEIIIVYHNIRGGNLGVSEYDF